jgi:hypothetical protein
MNGDDTIDVDAYADADATVRLGSLCGPPGEGSRSCVCGRSIGKALQIDLVSQSGSLSVRSGTVAIMAMQAKQIQLFA